MILNGLIKVDPGNADYYKANAQKFNAQLVSLDSTIKSGLSSGIKKILSHFIMLSLILPNDMV